MILRMPGYACLLIAVALAACQPKLVRPSSATAPIRAGDISGAKRYNIDGAASEVHVLVYRAGAMARLGHNHVVSSKDVRGALFLQNDWAQSRIQLTLPVATLGVDDPAARAVEGTDFAADVPQDAREGTRRNLLRAEVLDAEHFPEIKLEAVAVAGSRSAPRLTMRITIKGVSRDVPIDTKVSESDRMLTVTGEFAINQTDFGITPFSVALGALQVRDQLKIKFSLVCRQEQ